MAERFVTEAVDHDAVGGVVSAIVTATEAGDPVNAVCTFPAVSATEKLELRVRVDVRGVPGVAVDVAVMVQTFAVVWTIDVIAEIFENVKSCKFEDDTVVQLIGSLPVKVKVIVAEVDVAADAARVRVGGVLSTATGV